MHRGRIVPDGRLRSSPSSQYSSIDVSVVCEHSAMKLRSDQWRGSLRPSTWPGCPISSLSQDAVAMMLLAVLVIGHEEGEDVAAHAHMVGSMLVTGSGQTPDVIATDPGVR